MKMSTLIVANPIMIDYVSISASVCIFKVFLSFGNFSLEWKAENSGPSIWRKESLGMPPPVGQKILAVKYNKEIKCYLLWVKETNLLTLKKNIH